MEVVNISIVDFYKYCLDSAYERHFPWVLCFLAREADAETAYIQIQRYWNSLHDLTGNQILFIFAGALKEDTEYSSILYHESESWRGLRNSMLHIVDKEVPTIPYYKYPKIDFNEFDYNNIKANHTRSISDLRDYLKLSEKEIPSLVFTPTYPSIRDKHIVVSLKGENIYQEIKNIIENLEVPLKELRNHQDNYVQMEKQLSEISNKIEALNRRNKTQKKYIKAKRHLNETIKNTDSDAVRNSLITSMRNMSIINWNLFDHQTKANLNRYIDLLKNNPNIERECEKTDLEFAKLETEKNRLNATLEELNNNIISSHSCLREAIKGLSNKAFTDEATSGIGKRRFKIAFSFPGEHRDIVDKIARGVADVFAKEYVLYDLFHRSEFARPNLDTYLQNLYINESELIVVFICSDYNRKKWCGIEWRAIRELLNSNEADNRILFVKCGEGKVDGVFDTVDGYIDSTQTRSDDITMDIISRYRYLTNNLNET